MQGSKKIRSTDCRRCGLAGTSGERAHWDDRADAKPLVAQGCSDGGDRADVGCWSDQGIAGRGLGRRIRDVMDADIVESCAENGVD